VTDRSPLSDDARRVIAAQALRAFAYGLGALLLGTTLSHRGLDSTEVGVVLASIVAGTIGMSIAVARWSDRVGRRRWYAGLYVALAAAGAVYAFTGRLWLLVLVGFSGALSTDIIDNGPFTSLEQTMLATELAGRERIRGFGLYNAVATAAGSLGALSATGLAFARHHHVELPSDQRFFLILVPVALAGAAVALSMTDRAEPSERLPVREGRRLDRSRPAVLRLSALFAVDAFGGGFVIQAFIAYWFTTRFHTSVGVLGTVFFAIGVLQTASFLFATALAERFGLLSTMVFSHLPSNLLLAGIAFAPTEAVALGLLVARSALASMDIPARQAYVMALVEPEERATAAGYTNTVRYVVRPVGPILAGAGQGLFIGFPFLVAGSIKAAYDLALWRWFRRVPLSDDAVEAAFGYPRKQPAPRARPDPPTKEAV
jgi:MFS family permease